MTVPPDTRYPGPTLADRAQWLLRARPADYLLAMSVASASLPVVGKHLEPLGGYDRDGRLGLPARAGLLVRGDEVVAHARLVRASGRAERDQTQFVSEAALRGVVPAEDLDIEWPAPERTAPVLQGARSTAARAPHLGALRRPPVAAARRVAPRRSARRTRRR